MDPKILIVSPVRNEAAHIERVIRAVGAQTLAPARMIVIDDSSTDGTREILRALEAELAFLCVLEAPPHRASADRLARAIEAKNFNTALEQIDRAEFTHIMKLDGDIELPPAYLERLVAAFAADPGLGLAGGVLVEPAPSGGFAGIPIPSHHVHGALKLYTAACFTSIGGIQERLGWDTIDETYARMSGFGTRSFRDLVSVHHRPIGSADGQLRGRIRHGECAWILHYSPLWVVLRSAKVAVRYPPYVVSGLAFLYGYIRAGVRGIEQVPDPDFRRFTRRELRGRLWTGARSALSGQRRRGRLDPAAATSR